MAGDSNRSRRRIHLQSEMTFQKQLERDRLAREVAELLRKQTGSQYFPGAWYRVHSNGLLDVDQLRVAVHRRSITGRKVRGRWRYRLDSVCHQYPHVATRLREAVEGLA